MIQRRIFNDKEKWREFRAGYFTASESVKLLSEPKLKADKEAGNLSDGAMTYVIERAAEKEAPLEPDFYNSKMERGNEVEPQAALAIAEKFGLDVNSDDFIYTSEGGSVFFFDDEFNAGSTPDVILKEDICEIKCPDSKQHLAYMLVKTAEQLKDNYLKIYNQIQQNIWLAEKKGGWFISFDDRFYNKKLHAHFVRIPKDEEHLAHLKTKLKKAKSVQEEILTTINA